MSAMSAITLGSASLNSLIHEYANPPRGPALDWPQPMEWQASTLFLGWLVASVPAGVGTIGAYELGKNVFKAAGLDYRTEEDGRGRVVRIHVSPPPQRS